MILFNRHMGDDMKTGPNKRAHSTSVQESVHIEVGAGLGDDGVDAVVYSGRLGEGSPVWRTRPRQAASLVLSVVV